AQLAAAASEVGEAEVIAEHHTASSQLRVERRIERRDADIEIDLGRGHRRSIEVAEVIGASEKVCDDAPVPGARIHLHAIDELARELEAPWPLGLARDRREDGQ